MTMGDPKDSRALVALTELLQGAVERPTGAELDRGLTSLRTDVARKAGRSSSPLRSKLGAVIAVAAVAAGLGVFWVSRQGVSQPPVSVQAIEGGRLIEGGYLSASGDSGIKLLFNEGTAFVLAPGTRGRLRAVTSDGARLAIERGTASFEITRNHEHQWSVEAGPFLVTVKGTDFSLSWDPQSEKFELRLRRGRVVVSGPVLGDDLALRAGQNLTVDLQKAETVITEARSEDAPDEGSEVAAPPVASAPAEPRAHDDEAAPPSAPAILPKVDAGTPGERRWSVALAKGEWDLVLADAERDGIEATLQTASSDDLFALADAARYRRRPDLARSALLAQRRRFPRAFAALFLLGRVEELGGGGGSAAIKWYDEYLSQAPAGTYAAEALGRKMILSREASGAVAARPLADEYLRRFPNGSYAGAARALQLGP
jgi:ferric-dicitrate binding protein FerR (iron transport regulator)